jgi:hypothetical protein
MRDLMSDVGRVDTVDEAHQLPRVLMIGAKVDSEPVKGLKQRIETWSTTLKKRLDIKRVFTINDQFDATSAEMIEPPWILASQVEAKQNLGNANSDIVASGQNGTLAGVLTWSSSESEELTHHSKPRGADILWEWDRFLCSIHPLMPRNFLNAWISHRPDSYR